MGWGVSEQAYSGGKTLQHSGSNGFNYSTIWVAPKERGGIIVLTNQGAIGEEWIMKNLSIGSLIITRRGINLTH